MRVTILGSGTGVPEPDRFPSGVLLRGGGETVLVDLGPGVPRRLAQAGLGLEEVTAVFLTHFHTDHTAGVPELLFALRNPRYEGRPTLRLFGPVGIEALLGNLRAAWPRWLDARGYELVVDEIGAGDLELGGLRVTAAPIAHTPQSLGYRFEDGSGAVFAISGDATPCEGLERIARGAGLFVCEAAFPDGEVVGAHMSARQAGEVAARAGAETLCLTHFYPEWGARDPAAEVSPDFRGDVVCARDLMEFVFDARARRFRVSPPTG